MARKALVFWLLQLLPLIASSNSGSNATLDDCVNFDMANVEDLISALRAVEDPKVDDDDGGENLQPFGGLKSDWSRLQLLQKALPEDSILKDKFKHIFRLLTVAHDQATRGLILSKSTKIQDVASQSTISLDKEDRKDVEEIDGESLGKKSQEIKEKFNTSTTPISGFMQNISDANTTSKTSHLSTLSPEFRKDGVDSVVTKNITEVSAELGKEKEITVTANTTDLEPTIKSLVTTAAPIPSLEPLKNSSVKAAESISTLDPSMKSSVTTAAPIPSLEIRARSTASSVLIPVATVSKDETKSSTSTHNKLERTSEVLPSASAATEKEANSAEKAMKQYSTQTTEKTLKYVSTESSTREEYSSIDTTPNTTTTDIQSLNSTSSKNDSQSANNETKINYSPQSATTANPAEQFSTTEENSSSTTLSKFVPPKNHSIVSVKSDELLTTSTQKPENISLVSSSPETLLTNNFTAGLEKKEKSTSTAAKVFSTENTSIVSPTTKQDEEIELKTSNNQTEDSLSVNSTLSALKTTDFVEGVLITIFTTAEDRENKITTEKNQNEVSIGENSTADARKTTNSTEEISSVTPAIIDNAKITSTSQNNETETPMKKSTIFGWRSTNPTGTERTTIPSTEVNQDTKSTSKNNESTVSTSEKSIPDDKDDSSTPKSTSISTTSKLSTNTTKLVAATEATISSDKITQNSASTELPTKAKEAETSTRSYVGDQSTVPTERNEVNISKDIETKAATEIPKAQLVTDENSVNNSQTTLGIVSKEPKDDLANSAPVTEISELSSHSQSWFINSTPNSATKAKTETPKAHSTTAKNPANNQTNLEVTSKDSKDNLGDPKSVTEASELPSSSQIWFINTKPNFATKANTEVPTVQPTTEKNPGNSKTNSEVTTKNPKDNLGDPKSVTETSVMPSHSPTWFINSKPTFATKANTEVPTVQSTTEKNPGNSQTNPEVTSKDPKDNLGNPTSVTETSGLASVTQNWPIKSGKPNFMKNPLSVGSSRGNNIFREYKHGPDDKIVLYETGAGAKTGSVWKPQLARQPPAGNNIWFDGFPNNGGRYTYGYGQPASPANGKAEKGPSKFPALGGRTNLVRSRKRGSANADVEKQFRSFYRQPKPRVKESDNTRIKIQCKKPQQPH